MEVNEDREALGILIRLYPRGDEDVAWYRVFAPRGKIQDERMRALGGGVFEGGERDEARRRDKRFAPLD